MKPLTKIVVLLACAIFALLVYFNFAATFGYIVVFGTNDAIVTYGMDGVQDMKEGVRVYAGYGRFHIDIPSLGKRVVVHKNSRGICEIHVAGSKISFETNKDAKVLDLLPLGIVSQTERPNQALEPTTPAVMIRAGARLAPAGVVAHLKR